MKKVLGVGGVLVVVVVATSILNPNFVTAYNLQNILQRTALYGILGIGASFVIMAGGIDLSIGSVIGLVGVLLPMALIDWELPVLAALAFVLGVTFCLGLAHGILITKVRLQPFVVTLCGLLLYRGVARWLTKDSTVGFGGRFTELREIAIGKVPVPFLSDFQLPWPFLILLGLATIGTIFLNRTIYGRYLLAVGRNEQAARYSGINTANITILAYVLCAVVAGGMAGVIMMLDQPSVQPASQGSFYELYAIAAAVLGGCSLRGGEGSIVGVVVGAALIPVLYNASSVLRISTTLEFAILGFVILVGAVVDEIVKRIAAARRRYREAL
jgi:ribose transport system permease protein